jgi:hypothetical protein
MIELQERGGRAKRQTIVASGRLRKRGCVLRHHFGVTMKKHRTHNYIPPDITGLKVG